MRQLVAVSADLVVEGVDGDERFRGRVIAMALNPDDGQQGAPSPSDTWLLVADDGQPAPRWVPQGSVTGQRLGR
jgi:hypothetical protein